MSKRIFKKGRLVDLLVHVPSFNDTFSAIPDADLPTIFSKLVKSKRLCAVGLVKSQNEDLWLKTFHLLRNLGVYPIPVVQVTFEILNCKRFTFSCYFPPEEPKQVTIEFERRFESLNQLKFSTKMQALMDLMQLTSGFLLPTKVDLTPSSIQCVPMLRKDWGIYTFDIIYQDSIAEIETLLRGEKFQCIACSDALMLSQIASRSISVSEGNINFTSLRSFIKGKNNKFKYSINLHPTGVFREKFHDHLIEIGLNFKQPLLNSLQNFECQLLSHNQSLGCT
ncbi:MAG: hypothetical protein NZO16_02100 [Deltaproteobacteria bacterium]|nr:hypothetical protein [Deltaproteobacteria bacterium]